MQFLGRILDTVSSVSNLFSNPYRVRDVQLSEYNGKVRLKQEGRMLLYRNTSSQSWDCVLLLPDSASTALRLFQVASEEDAMNWFPQYSLKLRPFYETLRPPLKPETLQQIVDCLRNHPDWSSAHIAVETGLRDCLKHNYVLSQMNVRDAQGQTPLHIACERSEAACVRELLEECQARTDIKDKNGDTPMHCAAKQDSAAIVEVLCSQMCAGINEVNMAGETPLHVACRLGKVETAKALMGGGASCDIIGGAGYPIHTAMKYSARGCAEAILASNPAQLQAEDPVYGGTPLHWAKTAEMSRLLLDRECSVNYLSKTGESPLHILTKRGRFEAAMTLLTHEADPNIKGEGGNTALHLAMKLDHMDLIKALIVFGADVEIHNDLGETPGLIAARTSKGEGSGGVCSSSSQFMELWRYRRRFRVFHLSFYSLSRSLSLYLSLSLFLSLSLSLYLYLYLSLSLSLSLRVMVTSVLADRHPGELHIFRNYEPPALTRDPPYASTATFKPLTIPEEQLVWRAARSSGAAPTYFRPMGRFLDGGLLANNPTLDAMTEIHHYNRALKNQGGGDEGVCKLGVVVSLGTGKPPQVVVNSVDVFRPSNPLELAKSFVGVKELGKMLVDCCTDSDGCAVDRARAWCEMTDINYHRLSPQLSVEVMLDEVSDAVLVDMLWETQMYLYENRETIQTLSQQLLQP
uniref:phospholipase A2 n=1 Tax=Astyanax mexicanus TaxID=7994 RepID=A0A8B9R386_ASTMX